MVRGEMKHKEMKPSFFKVLIGDFSNQLRIPPAFVKNLSGSSLVEIILKSHGEECWVVKMEKHVNGLSFGSGWQQFVKDHSLEVGDFLVFKYHGNAKFSVKIFGKTGCEKKVKGLPPKTKSDPPTLPTKNGNQNQTRDDIQERKRKDREADNEESKTLRSGKKRVITEEVQKPPTRSAMSFESENSCFISTLTDPKKYYMSIPRELAREKNLMTDKTVKLRDPSGRSWQVKVYITTGGRVKLKEGWTEFWEGNRLAKNDTLIFEFMPSGVMQVHIFREEGNAQAVKTRMFKAAKIEAE